MLISGGNLISKASFNLQPRLVLLSWFKTNAAVKCCYERAYGSSMPVRYVPKKYRDAEKPEISAGSDKPIKNTAIKSPEAGNSYSAHCLNDEALKTAPLKSQEDDKFAHVLRLGSSDSNMLRCQAIEAKKKHARHRPPLVPKTYVTEDQKKLNNLSTDNVFEGNNEVDYFMDTVSSDVMEEPADVAGEIEADNGCGHKGEEDRLLTHKAKKDVEQRVVELLARRAYTVLELQKKLKAKHFPGEIVDKVLHDFQERGLLNDSLYAETYSRSRWSSSFWGPRRIKRELLKKGVGRGDVEDAVQLVFEEDEGQRGCKSRYGLSKSSLDRLYEQASKQWLRSQDAATDKRKDRLVRWLQYRGFDWGAIGAILKRLESEYPP